MMILQSLLIVGALVVIYSMFRLSNDVTTRAFLAPVGEYNVPYRTRGVVVYMTSNEQAFIVAQWIVTALLILAQLVINRWNKKG